MQTVLRLLATSFMLLASPMFVQAQPAQPPRTPQPARGASPPLTLTVEATDKGGTPLSDVNVGAAGPVVRSGATGQNGAVVFRSMRAGTYRLRFEREGFTTLERELVMRAGQPASVSVALAAAPVAPAPASPPAPAPPAPAPEPEKRAPRDVEPRSLSLPDFLDKNLIGGQPQKTTMLACAEGGTARLLQVRDPQTEQQHADVDEILYVVAGAGVLRVRDQDTTMRPGHFALVPRGMPHTIRREGRNPVILLSIFAGSPCVE